MVLQTREKRSFHFFLFLIIINLILLSLQVPLSQDKTLMKQVLLGLFTPLQAGVNWIWKGIENLWLDYIFLKNVKAQNAQLAAENLLLRQENILLRHVLEKLEKEQEIKERLEPLKFPIVVAAVIGVDAGNIFQSIIINRGAHHGIKANMVVLDPEGNLVGRIIDPVLPWSCRVQLITDETSGTGVITSRQAVSGILRGDGQGRCYLDYVLISSPEVFIGEKVLTSGLDGIYPAGLQVGQVISVSTEDALFKKIEVEPFFQLNGLRQVAVICFDFSRL